MTMKTFALMSALYLTAVEQASPSSRPQFPGHEETEVETRARYADIASDIVRVAGEQPPPRGMSRADGAALLLAMAIGESGLSADVDNFDCYRESGWEARCDYGESRSLWQTKEICATRLDCARAAYRQLRASLGACASMVPEYRLSAYGSGRCQELKGAADRWKTFRSVQGRIHGHMHIILAKAVEEHGDIEAPST